MNVRGLKFFSGTAHLSLAEKIARNLGLPLGKMQINRFSDGEIDVTIEESVRGMDVFLLQPTCPPVNENFMELLITIDAIRRAAAHKIVVLTPYLGYARKERKTKPRDAISGSLIARLLEKAGVHHMVLVDLHATAIEGFFNIPTTHILPTQLLSNAFIAFKQNSDIFTKDENIPFITSDNEKLRNRMGEEIVVVGPDMGAAKRARNFARYFNAPVALIEKGRPANDKSQVLNVIGDINNKEVVLVDDMISTGGTMIQAVHSLRSKGATKVYGVATHSVFVGNAIENLKKANFDQLFVTNSISLPKEKRMDNLKVISLAPMLASVIDNINHRKSVSSLFS